MLPCSDQAPCIEASNKLPLINIKIFFNILQQPPNFRLDLNSSTFGFREICLPNDLRFSFSMLHCSANHGFSLCFLVVLLNLKPACLHMSIKFCVNRSVIASTLLLFSAVFSLFFFLYFLRFGLIRFSHYHPRLIS